MVHTRSASSGGPGAHQHQHGAHQHGGHQHPGYEMERKYSVPSNPDSRAQLLSGSAASEDLHAWSIYRQNLNSDFTDSALGSTDKSPLPYGNFQLRDTTVQSILSHPRYGPKSALGSNMYTYLKFGLPRVFPPNHNGSNRSNTPQHFSRPTMNRPNMRGPKTLQRGLRDGSSGYDSSDNETTQQYKQNRKYRSDPDFRMQNVHSSYHQQQPSHMATMLPPPGGHPLPGMRPSTSWARHKSISEANLLASENYRGPIPPGHQHHHNHNRRNSVADFNHPALEHMDHSVIGRPMSKAGSDISVMHSRRGNSVLRGDYIHDQEIGPTFVYPHLQVRNLDIPSTSSLLLSSISFDTRGGDLLAIMSTSSTEGTALLDVLAGLRSPTAGDILLNGQPVGRSTLKSRVAYARDDVNMWGTMTTQQIMRFQYEMKKPSLRLEHLKIDASDRINVLIEDLGLDAVRHTKLDQLTVSEKRRLNVACHLLLDTDIVLLDQPTRGMDIFDTFFLIEYLRQWASGGSGNALGRIVILTLHPPTYEIFTMLSRVLLLSAGRVMYSGRRRDMLAYFSTVEYPCPSFKNPSDYYLDLVTLDDLSAEAMLESSQRIEQLADVFRRKQEPPSDPGPPTTLPLTVRPSNCFKQATVLFTKMMFYTQPSTFIRWSILFMLAVTLSLITGAIFWDVPGSDPQLGLNDRLGYHYTVMTLMCWPLMLALTLGDIAGNRECVDRDVRDGLYGRFTYIFVKTIFNLFPSLFIWLVFLVPCYSMSGLYMQGPNNYNAFYIYIGYMLLFFTCLQSLLTAFAYMFPYRLVPALLTGLAMWSGAICSGFLLSHEDMPLGAQWLRYASPQAWLGPFLARREYTQEAIGAAAGHTLCRNKQVQHQDIIVQLPCPPPNGTQVMLNFGFLQDQQEFNFFGHPGFTLLAFCVVCFVISLIAFTANVGSARQRRKRHRDSNKP